MISRPTTARGRATVDRVLNAACVLFAKQGVRATTLDDIGAAAQVGRGQLYHFFVDKADLVGDVVAFQVAQLIAEVQPSLSAMRTADDVRNWCREVADYYDDTGAPTRCPLGALVYELDEHDDAARAALSSGFAEWQQLLAVGLKRVASNGGLTAGTDPDQLAAGLLAAYQGGMLLATVYRDVSALRRALEAITAGALIARATRKRRSQRLAVRA